jgi:hypothetical protein
LGQLLWFHVFERDTVPARLEVLRSGPVVGANATTTKTNESALGIEPNCVYAYLGNAVQIFGDTVLSLPVEAIVGSVSPFDTGGLVSHIAPVKAWEQERQRKFLQQFSWSSTELPHLLSLYPSTDPAKLGGYLDRARPAHAGPHELWTTPDDVKAEIWSDPGNGYQTWLWEVRSPTQIAINGNLVAWSCSGPVYEEVLTLSANATQPDELGFFEVLFSRYVPGALSGLLTFLRAQQAAA